MNEIFKVKSLNEFIEVISYLSDSMSGDLGFWNMPWFRGISHGTSYKLLPSILRKKHQNTEEIYADNEYNILNEFIRKSGLLGKNGLYKDSYEEWLYLMQHYGLPTRLLDWTENSLVALYFAVCNGSDDEVDCPAVWVLNPYRLKQCQPRETSINSTLKYFFTKGDDGRVIDNAVSLMPFYIDDRMKMQNSRFTLHGKDNVALEDIYKHQVFKQEELERFRLEKSRGIKLGISYEMLVKILIHPKSCNEIKKHLRYCGVNEHTIYPDLSGLAKEIKDFYGQSIIEVF